MPSRRSQGRKSVGPQDPVEERYFVNPSAVSPHLFCPICQEAFVDPQRAPCGHSFCRTCIEPWLKDNNNCPIDRKIIPKGSMHHDFIVENIIGDYMVACPWRALGCEFIGQLHLLPGHKKTCLLNPGSMPPALRAHTTALLNRANSDSVCASKSNQSIRVNFVYPKPKISDAIPKLEDSNSTSSIPSSVPSNENSNSPSSSNQAVSLAQIQTLNDHEEEEDESVLVVSDDEAHLPPAPPPSLLLRLYQNSDNKCRDLLCNFIETTPNIPCPQPKRRRRGK